MVEAIGDLNGVKVFVDDILVYGKGETHEEAIEDHDKKVHEIFKRLNKCNIKLNPEKVQFQ